MNRNWFFEYLRTLVSIYNSKLGSPLKMGNPQKPCVFLDQKNDLTWMIWRPSQTYEGFLSHGGCP